MGTSRSRLAPDPWERVGEPVGNQSVRLLLDVAPPPGKGCDRVVEFALALDRPPCDVAALDQGFLIAANFAARFP